MLIFRKSFFSNYFFLFSKPCFDKYVNSLKIAFIKLKYNLLQNSAFVRSKRNDLIFKKYLKIKYVHYFQGLHITLNC